MSALTNRMLSFLTNHSLALQRILNQWEAVCFQPIMLILNFPLYTYNSGIVCVLSKSCTFFYCSWSVTKAFYYIFKKLIKFELHFNLLLLVCCFKIILIAYMFPMIRILIFQYGVSFVYWFDVLLKCSNSVETFRFFKCFQLLSFIIEPLLIQYRILIENG